MMLDMIPSDWIYGLLGGLMIGVAASVYLLVNGRIMGASGLLGGAVDGLIARLPSDQRAERLAFLAGLIAWPGLAALAIGGAQTNATSNVMLLILAGLLVGYGTRMANGCTSGHGVCGISRLSTRGIVATLAYLAMGGATMLIARHLLGVI